MKQDRFVISDFVWERIAPHLSGKAEDCGVTAADNRLFVESILWRVRTGAPWRDLPEIFGNWNSVFRRFRRWAERGIFERLFEVLSDQPDFEYAMIDGTIVSVHQKASGAKGGPQNQAIGCSRGGLSSKIVALVDALGNLVRFVLLPGQRHDMIGVEALIEGVYFDALLADKAFDADWLRVELDERGASAVIPPKANRKQQPAYDKEMYKWRHLVENYFAKIKEFRGIATRYDKTDTSYAANLNLVAAIIAAR
ncbi:MAG: IS5 family transposase [Planctomycetaceae bacterium]|nr:IS5 family transposase [Planctomycetaceae bacterium]